MGDESTNAIREPVIRVHVGKQWLEGKLLVSFDKLLCDGVGSQSSDPAEARTRIPKRRRQYPKRSGRPGFGTQMRVTSVFRPERHEEGRHVPHRSATL